MYREQDETARCPCCRSLELTPITKYDPSEGYARVHFAIKTPGPGFFDDRLAKYTVDRARICLGCGHTMFFVSEAQRADLEERLPTLAPTTG